MSDNDTNGPTSNSVFKPEISLGNMLILLGLMGTLSAGIWQGGMIRASLEAGLQNEHALRENEMTTVHADIEGLGRDIRELRAIIIADRTTPRGKDR